MCNSSNIVEHNISEIIAKRLYDILSEFLLQFYVKGTFHIVPSYHSDLYYQTNFNGAFTG